MKIYKKEFGYSEDFRSRYHDESYFANTHIHQYIEIMYVTDGSLKLTVDGKQCEVKSGEIAVITPFRIHSISSTDAKFRLAVCSVSCVPNCAADNELFFAREDAVFCASELLLSHMNSVFLAEDRRYVEYRGENVPRRIKALLYLLLTEYAEKVTKVLPQKSRDGLSALLIYIHDHYTENITLESAGREIGYNPKYLSQCLSTIPGMSFSLALNSLRISFAKRLLVTTDYKIINIAYESGFGSEQSFHRAFLKQSKMTPGEYRKRYK